MKFLVAGDWHSQLHEEAVAMALLRSRHDVVRFSWHEYFDSDSQTVAGKLKLLALKAQNKFVCGPKISEINTDLLRQAVQHKPDVVFIYRGTHILPGTIRQIRAAIPGVVFVGYNNDDPFGPNHPWWLWQNFMKSVPEYDLLFAYRHSNIRQYLDAGAKRCELLRSWYIPWVHNLQQPGTAIPSAYKSQIVFIGHYEPDGRAEMLEALLENGIDVKLFGPGYDWDPVIRKLPKLSSKIPIRLLWGEEYVQALQGAKLALCFLSKLNNDTYTRRCFEIPACGTFLLSEYSPDLAGMFREGEEAEYFRNSKELLEKVRHYLSDEPARRRIAEAGARRVTSDKHDVVSRMQYVADLVQSIREKGTMNGHG